jgi:peptidoglycan/LPS O-acetylase OafA/YrhL
MGKIYEWFVTMFGEKYADTVYRSVRTFIQTFGGTMLIGISNALANGFDALGKAALMALLASALSTAIAAVMNLPKPEPTVNE